MFSPPGSAGFADVGVSAAMGIGSSKNFTGSRDSFGSVLPGDFQAAGASRGADGGWHGHAAPKRAVQRFCKGCAARGAAFCKACLQTPWPARAHEVGAKPHRLVSTRTDSSAYGYEPLADFAQPVQTSKISCAIQTACLIYAYRPRQTKQLYIRCLKSLLRLRSAETARVTSRYIEIYEEW